MKETAPLRHVPLGEVATFVRGITFKPADVVPLGTPGAVICLRTKNVQADLDLTDLIGVPASFVRRQAQYAREGDTLISSANSAHLVGRCCLIQGLETPAAVGGFVTLLRPTDGQVDPNFLYRWFSSPVVQGQVRSFGRQTTNIANLSIAQCERMQFPMPPLPEQRRIAAILDAADALRAKRRATIAALDTLTQSIFLDMFDSEEWPVLELADVVREGTVVTYGIVQAGAEYPGGVPYIRTGDIKGGAIDVAGLRHTDPAIASKFARSRVSAGDIVMSIRATVGTTAVVPPELDGANLTQGTARICPGATVLGRYLLECLRACRSQRWIQAQVKGATFREITLSRLRKAPVPVPPMALQREFVNAAATQDRMRGVLRDSLAHVDYLFASLQSRAFRGEL